MSLEESLENIDSERLFEVYFSKVPIPGEKSRRFEPEVFMRLNELESFEGLHQHLKDVGIWLLALIETGEITEHEAAFYWIGSYTTVAGLVDYARQA